MFNKDLYPTVETFKYPKAGEKNAVVSLHLFDVTTKAAKGRFRKINDFILQECNGQDANVLSAQVLNRHQDNLDLLYRFSENYCCT
jgi:dipeptidyl-peptidase-4